MKPPGGPWSGGGGCGTTMVVVVLVKERKGMQDNIEKHKVNKTINNMMVPQTLEDFPNILDPGSRGHLQPSPGDHLKQTLKEG